MRIRCSKGLRVSGFHGHFFVRSTDLLALPQVTICSHANSLSCFSKQEQLVPFPTLSWRSIDLYTSASTSTSLPALLCLCQGISVQWS